MPKVKDRNKRIREEIYWKCSICGYEAKNYAEKEKHLERTVDDATHADISDIEEWTDDMAQDGIGLEVGDYETADSTPEGKSLDAENNDGGE